MASRTAGSGGWGTARSGPGARCRGRGGRVSADAAGREAERLGDGRLKAEALAGRAEIQLVRGEPDLAIREAESALALHRELHDAVLETEDQRILAVALGIIGKVYVAEDMLREVIDRATEHGRPLLVATAQRDLAQLLARAGKGVAAGEVAEAARAGVDRLGARVELRKLGASLRAPAPLVPPIAKPASEPNTFWSQE